MTSASTKEIAANALKPSRPHTPTDIGDQYLKLGPFAPGVVFHIMCQNRSGWPRSRISSGGQHSSTANAT